MITLVLEASTYRGSAALLDDNVMMGERVVAMRGREHEALMAAVGELFESTNRTVRSLQRVVCGAGPGSFTSLRIAGSIAKGLAMANGAQLIPVSSLTLLAASYVAREPEKVLAALDAMRGETYVQLHQVDAHGSPTPLADMELLNAAVLEDRALALGAAVVGPMATGHHCAVPTAASALRITKLINETEPANLAAWEPGYGRLAEAQVKWESAHGRPLPV